MKYLIKVMKVVPKAGKTFNFDDFIPRVRNEQVFAGLSNKNQQILVVNIERLINCVGDVMLCWEKRWIHWLVE